MTTTTITWDSTGCDADTAEVVNQTVEDMNQLIMDEEALEDAYAQLQADCAKLGSMSGENGAGVYAFTVVFQDVLAVLECQMLVLQDQTNISSDVMNISGCGESAYESMLSGATSNYADGTTYDGTSDADQMIDSVNVFLSTTFTVTTVDSNGNTVGSPKTADGLLELLSTPEYWPSDVAPMSVQDAETIEQSCKSIEDAFGTSWNNPTAVWNTVNEWYVGSMPTEDGEIPDSFSSQIDMVTSDFDEINTNASNATQSLNTQMQYLGTQYNYYVDSMSTMQDDYAQLLSVMSNNMLV